MVTLGLGMMDDPWSLSPSPEGPQAPKVQMRFADQKLSQNSRVKIYTFISVLSLKKKSFGHGVSIATS